MFVRDSFKTGVVDWCTHGFLYTLFLLALPLAIAWLFFNVGSPSSSSRGFLCLSMAIGSIVGGSLIRLASVTLPFYFLGHKISRVLGVPMSRIHCVDYGKSDNALRIFVATEDSLRVLDSHYRELNAQGQDLVDVEVLPRSLIVGDIVLRFRGQREVRFASRTPLAWACWGRRMADAEHVG